MGIWRHFRTDLERGLARPPSWLHFLVLPLVQSGTRAILCYRVASTCWRWAPLRGVARILKRIAMITTGAEIHPSARLGPGLRLPHPQGIVIGPHVTIEGDCTIFQGVTIGPRRADATEEDCPTIARNTFIYAGAKVLGRLRVGSRTQIGPNCVVFTDLPEGSTVMPPRPTVLEGLSFSLREPLSASGDPVVAEGAR